MSSEIAGWLVVAFISSPTATIAAVSADYPCLASSEEAVSSLNQSISIHEPCSLIASLAAARQACPSGQPKSSCVWLEALEALASGGTTRAEELLKRGFDLPGWAAASLRRGAQQWLVMLVDSTSCPFESVQPLIEWTIVARGAAQAEGLVMQLRLQGLEQAAAERLLGGSLPETRPRLLKAIEAFVDLTGPSLREMTELLNQLPGHDSVAIMPTMESWPPALSPLVAPLEAVDKALLEGPGQQFEGFMTRIESLAAELSDEDTAMIWIRAGIGLLGSGRAEDAALALHRAEDLFRQVQALSDTASFVRVVGASYRAFLSRYFQLVGEASRISAELVDLSPLERWFFEHAVCAPLNPQESAVAQRRAAEGLKDLLARLLAGEFSMTDFAAMEHGLMVVLPGLAGTDLAGKESPTLSGPRILSLAESFLIGDFSMGMEKWRRMVSESRFIEHLKWPAMVAAAAVRDGRIEAARRALSEGIAYVEEVLGSQRFTEVSRSEIDQISGHFYPPAVELAMFEQDVTAAFDFAERGRAFVFRRSVGAARARGASCPSLAESELERQAVQLLTQGDLDHLDRVRGGFAAERWKCRLIDANWLPIPKLISLEEARAALRPSESLIVFFPGVEKMWLWFIRRDHFETASIPWSSAQETNIRDLSGLLRRDYFGCGDPHFRGATMLNECPESSATDPAELLYEVLLAPIGHVIEPTGSLIIVPHGVLHSVPFAALRDARKQRLAENHVITLVPSVSDLAHRLRGVPRLSSQSVLSPIE